MKIDTATADVTVSAEEAAGLRLGAGVARFREQFPEAIGQAARIVADNPAQFGMVIAGSVVLARVMANLVKPRTLFEAVCTLAVCDLIAATAVGKAVKHGVLTFKLRDEDGNLVPWKPGVPGGDRAD